MPSEIAGLRRDRDGFRIRGRDMTRIETFTDAAFAFALTLLVISNDPLSSMDGVMSMVWLVPVFLMSASMLMMFWWGHHEWSRRYGLDDGRTILLSCAFVFTLLIYVYPLRFVFGTFVQFMLMLAMGRNEAPNIGFGIDMDTASNLNSLFIVYGVGFVVMSLLIVLLHLHAWSKRDELELDETERFLTRANIRSWLILAIVGIISILMAVVFPPWWFGAPGWAYASLGIIMPIFGARAGRQLKAIQASQLSFKPE